MIDIRNLVTLDRHEYDVLKAKEQQLQDLRHSNEQLQKRFDAEVDKKVMEQYAYLVDYLEDPLSQGIHKLEPKNSLDERIQRLRTLIEIFAKQRG